MTEDIIEYSFSESNNKTFIFVPGYSGALQAGVINELREYLLKQGGVNVFGLVMTYQEDTPDVFDNSQQKLVFSLNQIASKVSKTDIVLIAKSLGGSLALFTHKELPVSKIIILGSSIVLGWPQRISLLKDSSQTAPDYKREWATVLKNLSIPTLILNGGVDDLTDNEFLYQISTSNKNVQLTVIENADHSLEDVDTHEQRISGYFGLVKKFSGI